LKVGEAAGLRKGGEVVTSVVSGIKYTGQKRQVNAERERSLFLVAR